MRSLAKCLRMLHSPFPLAMMWRLRSYLWYYFAIRWVMALENVPWLGGGLIGSRAQDDLVPVFSDFQGSHWAHVTGRFRQGDEPYANQQSRQILSISTAWGLPLVAREPIAR